MDLVQTLVIFFGILNLTFGVFLYFNSKGRRVVKLYALIIVFATLWSLSTLLTGARLPYPYFRLAFYGHYIFGYLAYLSFFWFALFYPVSPKRGQILAAGAMTFLTVLLLCLIPTDLFANLPAGATLIESVRFHPVGYIGFILMLATVFFIGLEILLLKQREYESHVLFADLDRYQIYFAILANFVAGILGIVFNLIFPLYGNFSFFYLNPILVTGALVAIGLYNVFRYNLFNSRIILSEFFTGGILILSLTRFLLSPPGTEKILDGILLVVMCGFGVFLIQSIFREVRLRETLVKREAELEVSNQRQEGLLHFISHEIKGYLTKNEAAFAAIAAGDFGPVAEPLKNMSSAALTDTRKGVATVMDILDASNLKKGTVAYAKKDFDLGKALTDVIGELQASAQEKGLSLTFAGTDSCLVTGDEDKIRRHVLRNVIDNSIKYTQHGSVAVRLSKAGSTACIEVSDTGIGITPEDMKRLFTEGGHGAESIKVNVHSTGYGLFIAKQIVDAHGGTIRAESNGKGKGSRFIIEMPLSK